MKIVAEGINEAWTKLIVALSKEGNEVGPRGQSTVEMLNMSVEIKNPKKRILSIPIRKISLPFAFGEFLWYMAGKNDVHTMEYYSRRMRSFSDDGKTLNSAYGYRIFGKHPLIGFDQWANCVRILKADPDSRQAVIHLHTPNDKPTKDEVCTLSIQFLIRDGKLEMITNMRSNDVVWGFTYDVFNFTAMQELMANELGIEMGTYRHNAGSMHLYEKDYHLLDSIPRLENALEKMFEYDYEFDLGGLTRHSPELRNLMVDEAIIRAMDGIAEGKPHLIGTMHKYQNNALKTISEVLVMYAKFRATNDEKEQLEMFNFDYDNSIHWLMRNYFFGRKQNEHNVVIIEGTDGSGKTTYIEQFLKDNPSYHKVAFSRPEYPFNKEVYFQAALTTCNIIFDRSFYSEVVYSHTFSRDSVVSFNDVHSLESMLMFNSALLIFMDTDPQISYKRLDSDDAALFTSKHIKDLHNGYMSLYEDSKLSEYGRKFLFSHIDHERLLEKTM